MLVSSCGTSWEHWLMRSWERELFGGAYDDAKGFDRCKYGALQLGRRSEDSKGQMDCQWSSPEMIRSNCSSLPKFINDFVLDPSCKRSQRIAIYFKDFQSISYLPASYGEVLYDVCISSRIRAKVFAKLTNYVGLGPTRPMHGELGKWRASTLHLITPLADSVRSANTKCLTLRNVMNDYRGSQLQSLGTLCHHASPYNVFEPLRHVVHFPCWDMTNWARTMDHEKYQKYQNTFIHSDVPRRCGEGSAVWWFLPGAQGRTLAVLNVLNRFRRCACKPVWCNCWQLSLRF